MPKKYISLVMQENIFYSPCELLFFFVVVVVVGFGGEAWTKEWLASPKVVSDLTSFQSCVYQTQSTAGTSLLSLHDLPF